MPVIIKSIEDHTDYEIALKVIEKLWDAKPNSLEEKQLDKLTMMVERYEEKLFPMGMPDPIEAIKIAMEQKGITQVELGKLLGMNRVSEFLNYKRSLSKDAIRKLSGFLNIPTSILIQDYMFSKAPSKGEQSLARKTMVNIPPQHLHRAKSSSHKSYALVAHANTLQLHAKDKAQSKRSKKTEFK